MLLNRTLIIAALFLTPLSLADERPGSESGALGSVSDQGVPAPSEQVSPRGTQGNIDLSDLPPNLQEILKVVQNQRQAQQRGDGQALKLRQTMLKLPDQKLVRGPDSTGRVFIKFSDAARVRIDATGKLSSAQAIAIEPVKEIIAGMGLTIRSAFTKSAERLRAIEVRAEQYSGNAQPDLAGMYYLEGAIDRDLETAARAFNGMEVVEVVEFEVKLEAAGGGACTGLIGAAGACCIPNGGVTTCTQQTEQLCCELGGLYFGAGAPCGSGGTCPVPVGACCDLTGVCRVRTETGIGAPPFDGCTLLGESFRDGFNCSQADCTLGACCLPTGCQSMTQTNCTANDGNYRGDGVACTPDPCAGLSVGSCCLWDALSGSSLCLMLPQAECLTRQGFFVANGICSETECNPGTNQGACCIPAVGGNTCIIATQDECDTVGGLFTAGVGCSSSLLCDTVGSCCVGGTCEVRRQAFCVFPDTFLGVGTSCQTITGDPCADPDCGVFITGSCGLAGGEPDGSGGNRVSGPFCNDGACCTLVCTIDPFCCDDTLAEIRDSSLGSVVLGNWDTLCVDIANQVCSGSILFSPSPCASDRVTGPCFLDHNCVACDMGSCCTAVCAIDPTCCSSVWDADCVALARSISPQCVSVVTGTPSNFSNSQGYLTPEYYGFINDPSDPVVPPAPVARCIPVDRADSTIVLRGFAGQGRNFSGLDNLANFLITNYPEGFGTVNLTDGSLSRIAVFDLGFLENDETFPAGHPNTTLRENHFDLPDDRVITEKEINIANGNPTIGPTMLIIPDTITLDGHHGTACLGIIGAKDHGSPGPGGDELGIVGIAPNSPLYFFPTISIEEPAGRPLDAISSALETFEPGDVFMFPIVGGGQPITSSAGAALMLGVANDLGISSSVAAGNSSADITTPSPPGVLVVGACTPGYPFNRLGISNYGIGVDTSAWGAAVMTLGYGDARSDADPNDSVNTTYTGCFGGTSAAASQVAALIVRIQGMARMFFGITLTPEQIKSVLVANGNGTPQGDGIDTDGVAGGFACVGDYLNGGDLGHIGPYVDPRLAGLFIITNDWFDGNNLVDDLVLVVGDLDFGNRQSIKASDDNYYVATSKFTDRGFNSGTPTGGAKFFGSGQAIDLRVKAHLNASSLNEIFVTTEFKFPTTDPSGMGMVTFYVVELWNWGLSRYEFVSLEVLPDSPPMDFDQTRTHTPFGNSARFVNTRREVWIRITALQPGGAQVGGSGNGTPLGPGTFPFIIDQVRVDSTSIIGNPGGGGGLGGP